MLSTKYTLLATVVHVHANLGYLGTQFLVLLWILEEVDKLHDLQLGLLAACHITVPQRERSFINCKMWPLDRMLVWSNIISSYSGHPLPT